MEAGNDQASLSTPQDTKVDIRELRQVLELALILCDGLLQAEGNPSPDGGERRNAGRGLSAFDLANVERMHIQRVLNYTHGNKVQAAKLLNIGLTTIYRKMEEYGLE